MVSNVLIVMGFIAPKPSSYTHLYMALKKDSVTSAAVRRKVWVANYSATAEIGVHLAMFESHKCYVVVGLAIYKPCVILAPRVNGDLSI